MLCLVAVGLMGWALVRQFGAYEALGRAVRDREDAVTARQQPEAQLRQSQKLEAIGQLTSGVAHDFNNLLTAIIGNLEFLQADLAADPGQSRRLSVALGAADRAAKLTGQLLAFSRRQRLVPEIVDLNGIVRAMIDLLGSTLGGTIHNGTPLKEGLWPALGGPNHIE